MKYIDTYAGIKNNRTRNDYTPITSIRGVAIEVK